MSTLKVVDCLQAASTARTIWSRHEVHKNLALQRVREASHKRAHSNETPQMPMYLSGSGTSSVEHRNDMLACKTEGYMTRDGVAHNITRPRHDAMHLYNETHEW